ncbi:MAG TPA: RHS repeat-associated core domain-containing protein [Candidatus Acidoferrum sp.]|nr:RHS repeat-associated core domain-containing protein [Candidatus Acidoferrum sp.]
MKKSKWFLAWLALSLIYCSSLLAQVPPDVEQGLKPFGSYQHGNIDSVSLTNGNVMLHIPLVSYPQRGSKLSLGFFIRYNNKGWHIYKGSGSSVWQYSSGAVDVVSDRYVYPTATTVTGPLRDGSGGKYTFTYYNVLTADASSHEIVGPESIDASGIQYNGTVVVDRDGVRYTYPSSNNITATDPNGNQIIQNTSGWTDTLGRVIPGSVPTDGTYGTFNLNKITPGVPSTTATCPSGTASARAWNLPAFNGGTAVIKLCYADFAFQTSFGLTGVNEASGSYRLLKAVVLPNLTTWTFNYNSYLDLTSITFPTGGTLTYVWTNLSLISGSMSRAVTSRTLNANDGTGNHVWNYQWNLSVGGNSANVDVVTDPAGNDTEVVRCGGYACQTLSYSGPYSTGALLKTVVSAYSTQRDPLWDYTHNPAGANSVLLSQTTTWPGGKTNQTVSTFDSGFNYSVVDYTVPPDPVTGDWQYITGNGYYGLQVHQNFYDYGTNAPGPLLKQTSTSYQWQSDSNFLNENLLTPMQSTQVLDPNGNKCAETDYTYDNPSYLTGTSITMQHQAAPGPKRGNLSSVTRQLTATPCQGGASWRGIPSYVNVYDTGTTYQSTDPLGHTTTYTYSSTFYGAYPTQTQLNGTTTPGVSGSVTHVSTANYDFNTGLQTSATDENGHSTSLAFDNMSRLTQTSFPDGGSLTNSYQDVSPFGVTVTRKITATQNQVSKGIVDGVGRLSQTQLTDPNCTLGSGLVKMDFSYTEDATLHDSLTKTSTPYCDTPGTIYGLMTVNHSDTIGRIKSSVETDGSTVTSAYNDNQTTVTDEAGKQRKSQVDGLGRLTNVWEDPSGLNYETDYTYDPLGNLLTVNQKGTAPGDSSKWRTRTFTYDSLSRLLTAYNPESGMTTYTYNDDSTVATKTTPKQNQTTPSVTVTTTFAYDETQRLTSKTYSDGSTPIVKYIYDGVALSGCTPSGLTDSNPKPNRTSMCDAGGSSAWSHDLMGRILFDQRTNSGVTKTTAYTYNLNGSLATLTYPSGRVITYSYNAAARPTSAVDVANSINFATSATYAPQGALASLQNGSSLVSTMYFNNRLQPCRISVKSSGTAPASCTDSTISNVLDLNYNFNLGASDNGNVIGITNNRDTTRSQTFGYDALNRLNLAETISTYATSPNHCWGEIFQYDNTSTGGGWGNLTNIAGASTAYTGCTQENLNMTATSQNQLQDLNNDYVYDAAGNLNTIPSIASYSYDAENRLVTTAGLNYLYDGDGRRVAKKNGSTVNKIYWYGQNGEVLDETDGTGSVSNSAFNEYVFFGGERVARRDSSNNVNYYFADHLGTARIVANSSGAILDDSDFYPFGGERVVTSSSGNTYKFTGKERDSESGLDNFGARYDSSAMGRFTSVDPIWVKIDRLVDPQRLNLYAYGRNNPLVFVDPDGEDVTIGRCSIGSAQDCFTQLQAGLTKDDREHVKLVTGDGKNGCDKGVSCVVVDADYKSDSKNFQVLQTLANDHSATATVDVLKPNDSFDLKTVVSFDRRTGEKLGILSTTPGDPNEGTGFAGYTFFPYHKGDPGPFSPDDTTHVVANTVSDSLAATIHHELRHVFLGDFGRSAPKAGHGQPGVDQQTKAAEDEAKKNQNQ